VLSLLRGGPWLVFERWHRSLGACLRFHFFGEHYVSVGEPELIQELFRNQLDLFEKDLTRSYGPFMCLLGTGLVTSHGELWRAQRSLLSAVFNVEILGDVADVSARNSRLLIQHLWRSGSGSGGSQQLSSPAVELDEHFRRLTLKVITQTVLSLSPEESDRVFPHLYLPIVDEANLRVWYPWRTYLPNRTFDRAVHDLNQYIVELIRARKAKVILAASYPTLI
jgi:cytochrome P450